MEKIEWLLCPVCKNKTRIKLRKNRDNIGARLRNISERVSTLLSMNSAEGD